jgi:hypothetical protein
MTRNFFQVLAELIQLGGKAVHQKSVNLPVVLGIRQNCIRVKGCIIIFILKKRN